MRRLLRLIVFVAVIAAITFVGVKFWRGNPFELEGCSASYGGTDAAISIEQAKIAGLISSIGVERGLPTRAVSIALAAGYQESKLSNLPAGDRDSIGIFQQRPSQGWGTAAQIMDPVYSINAFYTALQKVPDYESMAITVAAQTVQHSGYPGAYARHEPEARVLASAYTGYTPGLSCTVHETSVRGTADDVITELRRGFGGSLTIAHGTRQDVSVSVASNDAGNRLGWAVAQYAVSYARDLHIQSISYAGKTWKVGHPSADGWTSDPNAASGRVVIGMG